MVPIRVLADTSALKYVGRRLLATKADEKLVGGRFIRSILHYVFRQLPFFGIPGNLGPSLFYNTEKSRKQNKKKDTRTTPKTSGQNETLVNITQHLETQGSCHWADDTLQSDHAAARTIVSVAFLVASR